MQGTVARRWRCTTSYGTVPSHRSWAPLCGKAKQTVNTQSFPTLFLGEGKHGGVGHPWASPAPAAPLGSRGPQSPTWLPETMGKRREKPSRSLDSRLQ